MASAQDLTGPCTPPASGRADLGPRRTRRLDDGRLLHRQPPQPKVAVTKLVNSLKGASSHRLRQEFPDLVRHYWRADKLWSGSYFAGTVGGAPLTVVEQYIEQQNRPV